MGVCLGGQKNFDLHAVVPFEVSRPVIWRVDDIRIKWGCQSQLWSINGQAPNIHKSIALVLPNHS